MHADPTAALATSTSTPPTLAAIEAQRAAEEDFANPAGAPADLVERVAARLSAVFTAALDEHTARVIEAVQRAQRPADVRAALGDDALLSRAEVAELLGIHPKTLATLVKEGKLPDGGRVGSSVVYSLGSVRHLLRASAGPAAAPAAAPRRRGRPTAR